MERVQKITVGLLALMLSSTVYADITDLDEWGIKPNIGIDIGLQNQSFSTGFGQEQFRETYPLSNIYIGAKFHPFFGMEIGYEHMYRQEKQQYFNSGVPVLGFVAAVPNETLYFSDVTSSGWNFNLLGFWPICPCTGTSLTGSIGIAWREMHYSTVGVTDLNAAAPLATWDSDDRAMLRLGFGVNQMITKHFGSRLQILWEDTSKLDATFAVPVGQGGANPPLFLSDDYTAKPKDSWSVLVGFFFQIT